MKCRHHIASTGITVLVASLAVACGGSSASTSPTPVPGGGNPQPAAKIGWSQPAGTLAEATSWTYGAYVDGKARVTLAAVTCTPGSANQIFDCVANLPQMDAGQHSLQLVAVASAGESPKSVPPLTVTVAANGSVSFEAK